MHQPIDQYAAKLSAGKRASVYDGTKSGYDARLRSLNTSYPTPDHLRRLAGRIKQHTIENLDTYLPQVEARLRANGVSVHWAVDGGEACAHVHRIMEARGAKKMVKAKTMVSEEIHLADYLEKRGMECLETDLGEFIIQIDHDHPSHIVKPIIHKNRREIAASFEKNGLGSYNDDPGVITARARQFLRHKYLAADVGLSGANFVSAESGRIVLVTNEGNSRFSIAATKVHIALVGIEKIVPRDRDLGVFLNLLARSATGQQLTSYTEFIGGARSANQPDGPEEMHVIFVDNGRARVLADDCRAILRCIRCSACLNVCPVYRQASGHAYRAVYPGPVGAVLSPLLAGDNFPEMADLPKASSLCGACNEVCPVNIPIPDLLLRLRDRGKREHSKVAAADTPPMGAFGTLANHPSLWKAAMKTGGLSALYPAFLMPSYGKAWVRTRGMPKWRGGKFRAWMKTRKQQASK
ncbi:L-lactate dehydrogenase complex protein LldF [Ereboglobus sp. PH5-5]|uniref:LutB/LldF family L-lactate oxidation iron-sulfur protein n=1 Tax=unclassified Ereboglobus TaxID=2626932 RepID=UPI002404DCB5|nr:MULTISPECIES: LutB/LldF family L-lactate oxidation iron-sulfur protein [unclassified Ereboglobus]MDF9826935.1 L-lactate dehydrogenase complex protein LldF [Ereboglobus sp. PH5-10]MDF9831956.1 L-lactate dehydrogenase complex protein LldF [Ereboglobus sp. PH5-5]